MDNPSESIHTACNSWADTKAAYRLFNNGKLEEKMLLQTHQAETVKRLKQPHDLYFNTLKTWRRTLSSRNQVQKLFSLEVKAAATLGVGVI